MGFLGKIGAWFTQPAEQLALPAPAETPALPAVPTGGDGVQSYGGYVQSGEQNSKLIGSQKWVTYANAVNAATVATGVRYFGNLLAGTEWHAEPNEAGGAGAERGAEICTAGLLRMSRWAAVVRKAAMYRLYGFSLFASAVRTRSDGMKVYSQLAHRPQFTIEKWNRVDDLSSWDSVTQRLPTGAAYDIPLHECLYCVDDTLTDSPEGVGLLRHVIQLVTRLERYEVLEKYGYEGDMAGLPIVRAPLEELRAAGGTTTAAKAAYVDAATQLVRDIVTNRIKTPEALQYWLTDSETYKGRDPNTISQIYKWGLEILKSNTAGKAEIHETIKRVQFEIARVLGIEFALVGAEGGSYSMHEDKTSMFATNLAVTLSELGAFATDQLARRLVALNGLDPETCTPRLVAEPISTDAIESVTKSLMQLQLAKLHPLDPARPVLRKRMRLPAEDPATIKGLLHQWEAGLVAPDPTPVKEAA